jgi:hypothetical protein
VRRACRFNAGHEARRARVLIIVHRAFERRLHIVQRAPKVQTRRIRLLEDVLDFFDLPRGEAEPGLDALRQPPFRATCTAWRGLEPDSDRHHEDKDPLDAHRIAPQQGGE